MEANKQASLYERLGGAAGISRITDDIVDLHMKNPAINTRYIPMKEDPVRMARVTKHVRQFLSMGTGGPETYEGQDMPTTHRGMNVSDAEFVAVLDDILAALDKNNVSQQEKSEVLSIAYSLKDQIVRL